MQKQRVLVYGATGSQASPIVPELLKRGHTPVVFTRSAKKAQDFIKAGAEVFEGDMLNPADTLAASEGVDAVALLVPFFMQQPHEAGMNAIEAAKTQGVKFIAWNTSGPLPPQKTGNPAHDVRLNLKEALADSGIPHVIFVPTVYAENLLGPWTRPYVQNQDKVAYPVPPDFRHGWLPSADMGKAIAAAIDKQAELAGKHAAATEYQRIWDGEAKPQMYAPMDETLASLGVSFTPLTEWIKHMAMAYQPEAVETK